MRWFAMVPAMVIAGCQGSAPPADPLAPRPVTDVARWRVERESRHLGWLVEKEIADPKGPIRYFLVENPAGQWVGRIDAAGRVYRYELFTLEERFVGMYAMDKALEVLYDQSGPLRITPAQVTRGTGDAAKRDSPR